MLPKLRNTLPDAVAVTGSVPAESPVLLVLRVNLRADLSVCGGGTQWSIVLCCCCRDNLVFSDPAMLALSDGLQC